MRGACSTRASSVAEKATQAYEPGGCVALPAEPYPDVCPGLGPISTL